MEDTKPVIILSDNCGVYIGSALGLGFWSKLDHCDQDEAWCFESESHARKHMESWTPADTGAITFPEVEDPNHDGMATEAACVAAGAEPWILNGHEND
jgi:hypothetical protein